MARVTVEDCIDKLPNRFELVLLAAHRARMISQGAPITVDRDNDKNPVVALREIADETIVPEDLREEYIHSMQKHVEVDEPEPTEVPLIQQSGDMTIVNDAAARRGRARDGAHDRGRPAPRPRRHAPGRKPRQPAQRLLSFLIDFKAGP